MGYIEAFGVSTFNYGVQGEGDSAQGVGSFGMASGNVVQIVPKRV